MRRLWLRWALLIIFVAALGIVFVNLGEWQLDRLAQRRERNATTVYLGEYAAHEASRLNTLRSALAEAAHLQLSQVYRRLGRGADADRELRALRSLRQKSP